MERREFIKTASGMVALGGGLFLSGPGHDAAAHVAEQEPGRQWSCVWPPQGPKRLSDTTHALARRAIGGEHGRSMVKADFELDAARCAGLSPDMRYAEACKLVARNAPLRVLPGERVVGSATLIEAPAHRTPVAGVSSISHTTIGFDRVLKTGYRELRRRVTERLARGGFDEHAGRDTTAPGRGDTGTGGRAYAASPTAGYWAEARPLPEYCTPPLTVECWAKLDSANQFNVLVLNRNKDCRFHWELYSSQGTGCFSAYLPGYLPADIKSDRAITDGRWHYLAMVLDASAVRLYVDGEEAAHAAVESTGQLAEAGGAFYVGGYPPQSIGCAGMIDEIRVSSQARRIAGVPTGPLEADAATIGLWRIGKEDGQTVLADSSPNGNHARPIVSQGGADFLRAMLGCLDAADIWHRRYMALLDERMAGSAGEERDTYLRVRETLRNVPENPATTFAEAVQSLWFMYAFQRLMGNWSGIGRIDEMLGPYLERDLAAARITLDEARELLAHFWIKGCEWIGAFDTRGSGDAQHYQNIVLSGIDARGNDVTNAVTYLVLDVVEELHISDFPIAVRLNSNTPKKLLRRIAEVQRLGGGIVALYNEEVAIDGLVRFGYPLEEARCFANDGCWEVLIPGKTAFSYGPFDALALLHDTLGLHAVEQPPPAYADFEALYAAFLGRLAGRIEAHHRHADARWRNAVPAPLLSLLVDDCIESARGYNDMGAHYSVFAPHAGGLANVANSLLVIRRLVFEEKYLTLAELVDVLRADWQGHEHLRQLVLNRFDSYGNDCDEPDAMMARVFNDYADVVARLPERAGVLRPAGISTFGREIEWRHGRKASPDGHREGEILATNCSPSPGTDRNGPTAVLKSYCKLDFTRTPNGATVELKIHPSSVEGDRGVDALVGLMRGFVKLGGMFMHVDVVDSAMLVDAQRHPEKYPNLSVRVAGWSARFATLNREWQDMIIGRTQQFA
ncbi:MAG: hypothetical protein JXR94_04325 [Candidatus Hydrogenedentes bacterium]|nr:hypothetical protein [Candidatus Hydrogenedentota bacterium]